MSEAERRAKMVAKLRRLEIQVKAAIEYLEAGHPLMACCSPIVSIQDFHGRYFTVGQFRVYDFTTQNYERTTDKILGMGPGGDHGT